MSFLASLFGKKPEEKKPVANNLNVTNEMLGIMGMTREQYRELVAQSKRDAAELARITAESERLATKSNVAVKELAGVGKKANTTNANLNAELAEFMRSMGVEAPAGATARPRSPTLEELRMMPQAEQNAYWERKLAELNRNGSSGGRRRSTRRRRDRRRRSTRRRSN